MAYCTTATVRGVARQLTARVRSDDDITNRGITPADALIDAHLAQCFDGLPFSPVPALIAAISSWVAASLMLQEIYGEDNPDESSYATVLWDRVFGDDDNPGMLEDLKAGKLSLGTTTPAFTNPFGPRSTTYDVDTDTARPTALNRGDELDWKDPADFTTLDDDIRARRNGND